jgi:hypothetical protein
MMRLMALTFLVIACLAMPAHALRLGHFAGGVAGGTTQPTMTVPPF